MSNIPENSPLLKHLFALLKDHRPIFKQDRIYQRVVALVVAELFVFARHTVSQLLMALGLVETDWSAMYRVFSQERFSYEQASKVICRETLKHVAPDELYVVCGDATQTPRNSAKIEGVSWLRNLRTPPFRTGIHHAQRWFNGCWMLPPENGYSRAVPLRWLPAFTEKAQRQVTQPCSEWAAALIFLNWLLAQFLKLGRASQTILFLGDGNYDTIPLWKSLPEGVIMLARSARNRALFYLPTSQMHRSRKYGEQAPAPQDFWREKTGWKRIILTLRGHERRLQYRLEGPFLRRPVAHRPLFLLIIRGQKYSRKGRLKHREPRPYLVNAVQDSDGQWVLPLEAKTLIFWAWQRWEIEVCHRELKSNFGLGNKQCWNPHAAVLSVQWTAWVYTLLILSAYRTWGLCAGPPVPTGWWRGAHRWSFNTLWRAYRSELWGPHNFRALWSVNSTNWGEKEALLLALRNAIFGSVRA